MKRSTLMFWVCALALLGAASVARAQDLGKLDISAFAVNMSNIGAGGATTVQITVDRWSTADERKDILATMVEMKNQDALLKALQKSSVKGRFRIPGLVGPDPHQLRLGQNIRYAWQSPLPDGGTRIVLGTDRYIGFQEARNQPRTVDYPFTLIEIRVNKAGEGEGKMAVATMIDFDKDKKQLILENYSSEPLRLSKVTVKAQK
jgi:hypothetical protein